jgi:hypothetical protein
MARGGSSEHSSPRTLIASRVASIQRNYSLLAESMRRHYPDSEGFVDDWTSTDFEAAERLAALERFYERIINSLNQIVDQAEAALEAKGQARQTADSKDQPGRWRRLEIYGVLDQRHVKPLKHLANRRNIFQKEYPDLGPEAGAAIYEDAEDFIKRLPKVLPGVQKWAAQATSSS